MALDWIDIKMPFDSEVNTESNENEIKKSEAGTSAVLFDSHHCTATISPSESISISCCR